MHIVHCAADVKHYILVKIKSNCSGLQLGGPEQQIENAFGLGYHLL